MTEESVENLVEKKVTYTLYKDDKFYIVENVPARVDVESGEQYFSPKTVEHLQLFWGRGNLFTQSRPRYTDLGENYLR